jgi:hypothetical protein
MANEQTTGAPLTAPLGERLEEKGRMEEARAAERAADETVQRHVERKKAEEREAAARHAAASPDSAAAPAAATRSGRRPGPETGGARVGAGHPQWQLLLGGFALFGALLAVRRLVRR